MDHEVSRSWQIHFDFPAELQFAAYLAREAGFSPEGGSDVGETGRQWRVWWEKWVENQAQRAVARQPWADDHAWPGAGFRPPDFEGLAEAPALRQLFCQRWPAFHEGWARPEWIKMQMAEELGQQLQRVKMQRLVRAQARAVGLAQPLPFTLVVDFVLWPEDFVHERAAAYLLLGAGYLQAQWAKALAARLGAAVGDALGQYLNSASESEQKTTG